MFVNQVPTKHVIEKQRKIDKRRLPDYYCHKYTSYPCQPEEYVQDSRGDFINVAVDSVEINAPEYVASSNIVVPKYLVHGRLIKNKFVIFFSSLFVSIIKLN